MDAFFQVIRNGDIVSLDPPVRKHLDFHKGNFSAPAEVILTFTIGASERDDLMASIIDDSPQMANAVGNLPIDLSLSIKIGYHSEPGIYACISRISLCTLTENGTPDLHSKTLLLDIDRSTALIFHEKYRQHQHDQTHIRALQQFLAIINREDWARIRRDIGEGLPAFRRFPPTGLRVPADPEAHRLTEAMLTEFTTMKSFVDRLRQKSTPRLVTQHFPTSTAWTEGLLQHFQEENPLSPHTS